MITTATVTLTATTLIALVTCSLIGDTAATPAQSSRSVDATEQRQVDHPVNYEKIAILPGSAVRLSGSATIGSWQCVSREVDGAIATTVTLTELRQRADAIDEAMRQDARLAPAVLTLPKEAQPAGELVVAVKSLKAGNARMERDMYAALQATQHPTIKYELLAVDEIHTTRLTTAGKNAAGFRLITRGYLTLAGRRREMIMDVEARRLSNGTFSLIGKKQLNMTDFGVTPPTALLGLIRSDNEVEIVFELVVGEQSEHSARNR